MSLVVAIYFFASLVASDAGELPHPPGPTASPQRAPPATAMRGRAPSQDEDCTPGYDPCIPPGPDVDCAGGRGDGPRYIEGPVYVTGSDPYKLDRDGDGVGCG